jgi:hypothetical protein
LNYSNSTYAKNPGSFALQVHKGYAIDVRFKNIMILQGCGDSKSPNYDGEYVQGFPKQPAVYQDDGSCTASSASPAAAPQAPSLARYLGIPVRDGVSVGLEVRFPGRNALDISGLDGRSVFSGSAPGANTYRLSARIKPGLHFVKLTAGGRVLRGRILIP